ncbi:uncharacterized protein PSFLO_01048 [Pseudozyma flocculosa]|uniref:Uncharacterized protein n=1 Tax=Pseudozyma flocculosa TaxID=84751 RepID=A0A5C3EVQ4_9BASI|nr:uncharacterized protein PSFLO_01048 [Pseudozyma flocculosa]
MGPGPCLLFAALRRYRRGTATTEAHTSPSARLAAAVGGERATTLLSRSLHGKSEQHWRRSQTKMRLKLPWLSSRPPDPLESPTSARLCPIALSRTRAIWRADDKAGVESAKAAQPPSVAPTTAYKVGGRRDTAAAGGRPNDFVRVPAASMRTYNAAACRTGRGTEVGRAQLASTGPA